MSNVSGKISTGYKYILPRPIYPLFSASQSVRNELFLDDEAFYISASSSYPLNSIANVQ
jgi:hypothetical protein